MRNVDGKSHVREVKTVAQPNERYTDDVMSDQLPEVLARLLHSQQQHDGLLRPVGRLEQVIELEHSLVSLVGKALVHAPSVEVPDRRPTHDVHTGRSQDAKVQRRVHLLHKARLLAARLEATVAGEWAEELLHDELSGEGENDGIECDQSNVPGTFGVLGRSIWW